MTIKNKVQNILWIDWWSKYIWLAYCQKWEKVVFPVGYLINNESVLFDLSDVIIRYNIKHIVIWRPKKQKDIQEKIQKFINNMNLMVENKIEISKMEEDFSTTKAGEILSNFKKNAATDTVSAMEILNRRVTLN